MPQKISFNSDEVMMLISGRKLTPAVEAKLALCTRSNIAVRLRGMRFHYDIINQGFLYLLNQKWEGQWEGQSEEQWEEQSAAQSQVPDLFSDGFIDYEALD